jgi:hypothetical protein
MVSRGLILAFYSKGSFICIWNLIAEAFRDFTQYHVGAYVRIIDSISRGL